MYIHEQLHMHGRDAHLELSADINCVLRGERQEHEAAGAQRRRGRPARSGGEAAYARERSERNIPPQGIPPALLPNARPNRVGRTIAACSAVPEQLISSDEVQRRSQRCRRCG